MHNKRIKKNIFRQFFRRGFIFKRKLHQQLVQMQSNIFSDGKLNNLIPLFILLVFSCNDTSLNNGGYIGIWVPKTIIWEREKNIEYNETIYSSFKTILVPSVNNIIVISSTNYLSSKDSAIIIPGEPLIRKYKCGLIYLDSSMLVFKYNQVIQDLKLPSKDKYLGSEDTIYYQRLSNSLILNGIEYVTNKNLDIDSSYLFRK